eukprot:TRINITY_DN12_c2_g1_i1.p2 TRINITY_DN12_c2_g1~~TRINITY_DN12_c2_g1_i1.p2  ORF type:complete len:113 (-),score=27.73 TRINITY_DN12_c2_g1_i1:68-406(-)
MAPVRLPRLLFSHLLAVCLPLLPLLLPNLVQSLKHVRGEGMEVVKGADAQADAQAGASFSFDLDLADGVQAKITMVVGILLFVLAVGLTGGEHKLSADAERRMMSRGQTMKV